MSTVYQHPISNGSTAKRKLQQTAKLTNFKYSNIHTTRQRPFLFFKGDNCTNLQCGFFIITLTSSLEIRHSPLIKCKLFILTSLRWLKKKGSKKYRISYFSVHTTSNWKLRFFKFYFIYFFKKPFFSFIHSREAGLVQIFSYFLGLILWNINCSWCIYQKYF